MKIGKEEKYEKYEKYEKECIRLESKLKWNYIWWIWDIICLLWASIGFLLATLIVVYFTSPDYVVEYLDNVLKFVV